MKTASNVRLKSVALPAEHGGWGFLLEPVLLGLLVAPTLTGVFLSLSALGIFLVNQPLKLALKDRLKGKRYPRTVWAERFVAGYGALAVLGFGLALPSSKDPGFIWPLLLAVPFALVQTLYVIHNRSRESLPEISGAIALGAVAPTIAITGGWGWLLALSLWLILALRDVVSILYVRVRLRLGHGELAPIMPIIILHGVAVLLLTILAMAQIVPWLSVVAMVILMVRAVLGLALREKQPRAMIIGFQEIGFGLLMVILSALGYR